MSADAGVEFCWQAVDPGRAVTDEAAFKSGHGFESFVAALRDFTAYEAEHTPEGFVASGNISVYWWTTATQRAAAGGPT